MPAPVAYFYMAIVTLGGATLFWSFSDGRAGNLMFDGGSAFLYGTTVVVYLYSVLPNFFANFTSLPLPFTSPTPELPANSHPPSFPPFPQSLRAPTLDLASSHLICSVALTGVLALQAGRWWAEQADIDEDDEDEMLGGEETEDAKLRTRESSPAFVDADKKQK
ncbi:hypothetical protein NLI96_g6828 [Meripilus lineatus]|uniref:Shr3 amino acid permease chaperone n=1 Tax=Meripilus lineatus TaxID=2056292 RepID=A0AAD5V0V1_9APHY|nr:hypothetical protein NLI96_g6828 [Physisporinus lineatus]